MKQKWLGNRRVLLPVLVVLISFALLGLAACGGQQQPANQAPEANKGTTETAVQSPALQQKSSANNTATPARQLEKVVYTMPVKAISTLPMMVGIEHGFFKEEGLDVNLVTMKTALAMAALETGEVDYALQLSTAISSAVQGLKTKAVMTFFTDNPWTLMVDGTVVKEGKDLKGKAIALQELGTSQQWYLEAGLAKYGLKPTDVIMLSTGSTGNSLATISSKQVVGAVLSMPFDAQAEKMGFKELMYLGNLYEMPFSGISASADKITNKRDQVKRIVRGALKAMAYIKNNKQPTIEIMKKELAIEPDVANIVYERLLKVISPNGVLSEQAITNQVDLARKMYEVKREIKNSEVSDSNIAEEAYQELFK